jgi:hypothetical protein
MWRRLFTSALVLLASVFCAATLTLWVLSSWTTLWIDWSPHGAAQYRVYSARAGIVYFSWDYPPTSRSRPFFNVHWDAPYETIPAITGRRYVHAFCIPVMHTSVNVVQMRYVLVPFGWLLIALAALPGWSARRAWIRRRRRRSHERCGNCGYDLRATPERCPECGTVPASEPGSGIDAMKDDAHLARPRP